MDSCAVSFDLVYEGVTYIRIICLVLKSEAAALKNIIRDLQLWSKQKWGWLDTLLWKDLQLAGDLVFLA